MVGSACGRHDSRHPAYAQTASADDTLRGRGGPWQFPTSPLPASSATPAHLAAGPSSASCRTSEAVQICSASPWTASQGVGDPIRPVMDLECDRRPRRRGSENFRGEQGCGKTYIGAAAAHVAGALVIPDRYGASRLSERRWSALPGRERQVPAGRGTRTAPDGRRYTVQDGTGDTPTGSVGPGNGVEDSFGMSPRKYVRQIERLVGAGGPGRRGAGVLRRVPRGNGIPPVQRRAPADRLAAGERCRGGKPVAG